MKSCVLAMRSRCVCVPARKKCGTAAGRSKVHCESVPLGGAAQCTVRKAEYHVMEKPYTSQYNADGTRRETTALPTIQHTAEARHR